MKDIYLQADAAAASLGCRIFPQETMSAHTTFRIGGPADRLYTVETPLQLKEILKVLREDDIPYMILGKGSNLLVSDKGIRGAVLLLTGEFKNITETSPGVVRAGAAASLASVCSFARDRSLTGLEFAWGIPGSAGGAAYMNAGAYGGEMCQVISRVWYLDEQGEQQVAEKEQLSFAYRKSMFTGTKKVITQIEYQLAPGSEAEIRHTMEDLMQRRKDKQPYDLPSAGSIFKRPEKGYAAALIEECGLKGRSVGDAQVSPKHSGFIVNMGQAKCSDVLALIAIIQETVQREKQISLECEVRVTGEQ